MDVCTHWWLCRQRSHRFRKQKQNTTTTETKTMNVLFQHNVMQLYWHLVVKWMQDTVCNYFNIIFTIIITTILLCVYYNQIVHTTQHTHCSMCLCVSQSNSLNIFDHIYIIPKMYCIWRNLLNLAAFCNGRQFCGIVILSDFELKREEVGKRMKKDEW